MELTVESKKLFKEFALDADNWSGMPLVNGNVEVNRKTRGNLSDLVKKGLVKVETSDGDEWVIFTEEGKKLAFEWFQVRVAY